MDLIAKEPSLCNQKRAVSLQSWIVAIAPIDSTWWMDEGFGGDLVGICHNRPSEAQRFRFGGLQAALQASPSLAWSCPRYAISDGGFAASLCNFAARKKSRLAEKELRLLQTGQYRVRRPVGEFAFWVFSVAMIWR